MDVDGESEKSPMDTPIEEKTDYGRIRREKKGTDATVSKYERRDGKRT